ncbi:cold-shock-like DNA binding protein [Neolewinella xylanilytica]|uniref:Cold-shock-like DNA binding protein n=1 Tax=Neolewinella xylanilytica TaxID=1514080 RepID=A0A2S6I1W5_9BACT|nr:cold shock domain-containing protein [Neolewinella xylanilytica]PPK85164.1 cold-shock-like DNA binding protein [Neolewinella xylanilytica]
MLPEFSLGVVLFYLPEKGYGYLRLEGTREEFHFRKRNVVGRPPGKGDRVRFSLREGRQGYYADQVTAVGMG